MGLNASWDHFYKMSDLALSDVAKNKIVDVMVEGHDVNDIYMHVCEVLLCCHEHGLLCQRNS